MVKNGNFGESATAYKATFLRWKSFTKGYAPNDEEDNDADWKTRFDFVVKPGQSIVSVGGDACQGES